MKTLKFRFFAVIMLFICAFTFINCSSEDYKELEGNDFLMHQRLSFNLEVDTFVDSFYKNNFEFGDSIETSDETNTYVITEVKVNSESIARGYVVTEKFTEEFLYFVDVNRIDHELTTVEVQSNETKVYFEINKNDDYLSSDEFDFIKIIDSANANPQQRRRFWGWSGWQPMGPCENGFQSFVNTHYVLWLTNVREYDVRPC